ncbi:MAG: hypothetical protein KJ067_23325 [Vicinamibacteria bacterium]|nr:hypothetical protein [Vicinamibacteria bacterium]
MTTLKQAPPDAVAEAAYERIAEIAREHCLVMQSYGGVLTLATPAFQRREGLRERVLRMHCATEQNP